jgi:hypothetical protein
MIWLAFLIGVKEKEEFIDTNPNTGLPIRRSIPASVPMEYIDERMD